MQFRDLHKQYEVLKKEIDAGIESVLASSHFIIGEQVKELETQLAEYVGVKHCITCGNGSDALQLALMAWGIGKGDAVFVPDFTYIASAGCAAILGATPVFVDVSKKTFNMCAKALEAQIQKVLDEGKLTPKAVVIVDLFGQPADFPKLLEVAKKYNLKVLEDGAQGFGGSINGKRACSFGDIATTSFFPAKPLGCYGDGGAIFTDSDDVDALLRSMRVHGRSPEDKYDNSIVGMNSRLDTLQAAILLPKLKAFIEHELDEVNAVADKYTAKLADYVITPHIKEGYISSWAQYTIQLKDREQRTKVQAALKEQGIPSMIYYPRGMHRQTVFAHFAYPDADFERTNALCDTVLSLPVHPYMTDEDIALVCGNIIKEM